MVNPVFIANRGPIAYKAMRALHGLGVSKKQGPIMPYTAKDIPSAGLLGIPWFSNPDFPRWARPVSDYLNLQELLVLAKTFEAKSLYPGFGFFAENPQAAKACEEKGITWVGPSSAVLELCADKARAKKLAFALGVPVIPGTFEPVRLENALQEAARIGYPVRIKSISAGGGRGQAVVSEPGQLKEAMQRIATMSQKLTGDDRVILEKHLEPTRHIEVQFISDGDKVLHFGARNCSIQIPGRYQKLMEKAVYPGQSGLSEKESQLIQNIIDVAVKFVKGVNYRGVGTFEVLVDKENNFYFMEVNPRIQVEHPVTEMVARVKGKEIDLIEEQFKLAAGLSLDYDQTDITFVGHSIQARIIAMDFDTFMPFATRLKCYKPPQLIPGKVRLEDGGLSYLFGERGFRGEYPISMEYDPMFAQLIVWNEDRLGAMSELSKALINYRLRGKVKTSIPFIYGLLHNSLYGLGDEHIFTDFTAKEADIIRAIGTNMADREYREI